MANPFRGGGMDIFWNHTMHNQSAVSPGTCFVRPVFYRGVHAHSCIMGNQGMTAGN